MATDIRLPFSAEQPITFGVIETASLVYGTEPRSPPSLSTFRPIESEGDCLNNYRRPLRTVTLLLLRSGTKVSVSIRKVLPETRISAASVWKEVSRSAGPSRTFRKCRFLRTSTRAGLSPPVSPASLLSQLRWSSKVDTDVSISPCLRTPRKQRPDLEAALESHWWYAFRLALDDHGSALVAQKKQDFTCRPSEPLSKQREDVC